MLELWTRKIWEKVRHFPSNANKFGDKPEKRGRESSMELKRRGNEENKSKCSHIFCVAWLEIDHRQSEARVRIDSPKELLSTHPARSLYFRSICVRSLESSVGTVYTCSLPPSPRPSPSHLDIDFDKKKKGKTISSANPIYVVCGLGMYANKSAVYEKSDCSMSRNKTPIDFKVNERFSHSSEVWFHWIDRQKLIPSLWEFWFIYVGEVSLT